MDPVTLGAEKAQKESIQLLEMQSDQLNSNLNCLGFFAKDFINYSA
jgi:hypothetical protein